VKFFENNFKKACKLALRRTIGEIMEHQALYRKYRPHTFSEVIGQEHITRAIQNQIASGKISHAYLFTGSRGIGKTSVARIFARAVNCENNQNGSPCGECETCKRLEKENDINIIEIDAASNNRVDDIREIREKVKFMPVGAKYKVYIIDEVHMLTDSAFNALLKTLEEPPSHVIFILATTEVHKLPATILSRCVRFDFRLLSIADLSKLLADVFEQEGIDYEKDALRMIASSGEGSVRDTLSIADCIVAYSGNKVTKNDVQKVLGTTDYDLLLKFYDLLLDREIGGMLAFIDELDKSGKNMSVFVKDLSKHARNLLVCSTCASPNEILALPNEVFEKYMEQSQKSEERKLVSFLQIFSSAENELRYTLSPRLLLEALALTAMLGGNADDAKKN
jgi:DNA polymerase-3 subunit gamma/tau